MSKREFSHSDSKLDLQRAIGHFDRLGHHLAGYWTDDEFPSLVTTCCK